MILNREVVDNAAATELNRGRVAQPDWSDLVVSKSKQRGIDAGIESL